LKGFPSYKTLRLVLVYGSSQPSCQDLPLFNVWTVNVFLHYLNDREMAVIYWLLETALALQTMEIQIPQCRVRGEEKYKQFLT